MSDSTKKPREIDLRARLGRGKPAASQSPSQGPAESARPTSQPPQHGAIPQRVPSKPPRGSLIPGIPGSADLVRPPFHARSATIDPFAPQPQQAQQGPREVRLVIDERPVADKEVGRSASRRTFLAMGLAAVIALGLGYGIGNVVSSNKLWNMVLQDARDIYAAVDGASATVLKAQQGIAAALEAASPQAGTQPALDMNALTALKALKKPLDASAFTRRHYKALNPATVDALFAYYNNINVIWNRLDLTIGRVEQNKPEIEKAAKGTSDLANVQYGCLPMPVGDSIACRLGVVSLPDDANGNELPTELKVAARVGSSATESKTRYQGGDLKQDPNKYVILIDTRASLGVLGQQLSAFANYRKDLVELKKLVDETVEIQGTLLKDLGQVKTLK